MIKKVSLVIALLLLVSALPEATRALAAGPAAGFPQETSDLKADPAVRFGRLDNGLRYALLKNSRPQGRASLRLGVMAGSLQETEQQRGLAHFLEHLAFNGSAHFPPGTLVEYFQRLGMSFGGDTNASTNFDRTVYQLELPDTKAETLEHALTLFADYGGGLLLKPESIEKERGIILSEARDRDSQQIREWQARTQFSAPGALFTQRLPIGTAEVIRTAPREQIADFYDAWYRPENLIVVAVGDFDVAAVEAQIKQLLSPLKARAPARPAPNMGKVAPPAQPLARFYRQPESGEVSVGFDVVLPYVEEKDTAARRLKELRANLALGMLNRRYGLMTRQEGVPISGGQVQMARMFHFMQVATLDVACKESSHWRECLASGEQELRRALEFGFQESELQEIVANLRNRLQQSERMVDSRPSPNLAEGLLGTIMNEVVFTDPATDRALFEPALQKMTVADCLAGLRELFGQGIAPYVFVSGNIDLKDQDVLAAYEASLKQPVKASEKEKTAKFAYGHTDKPGDVAQRRKVEDLGIELIEFKNGVRLNLKRTDFEPGRIYVDVRVGGGILSLPTDKPGLAMLAGRTYISGGLGKHSIEQLSSLLAGKNVGYRFSIGGDAFDLSGGTTPDDLLLQLEVLQAFLTDPGYRPEALREFREGLEPMYAELSHSIAGPQNTDIPRLLANGDPRFGLPPRTALEQRNFDEVRAWLAPQFASGAMEISIVGDFDVEKTVAAVAQTFGALPQRQPKPAYASERRLAFPKEPLNKQYTVDTELPRGLVDIRWPATDGLDAPTTRRLAVLSGVFADRLRVRLREQMGQAYSPGVQPQLSDTFPGYGFVMAGASVAPDQAGKVAASILDVAADLASKGITEDELKRAKEPMLTQMHESVRQNGYWLGGILSGLNEFPQRLDWHRTREKDFLSIDKPQIDALAKQYLDPKRASQFIMLPQAPKTASAP